MLTPEWRSFSLCTMKSLGNTKNESGSAAQTGATATLTATTAEAKSVEKIDFSKVKVEPLFEESVDFDTFSKPDFRAVKEKECVTVPKSKRLLQSTLDGNRHRQNHFKRYSRLL